MNRRQIGGCLLVCLCMAIAQAQDKPLVREIFVPFDDLNVILEADANRVFLSRKEYEDLLARSQTKAVTAVPLPGALLKGQYDAKLSEGRAVIQAKLELELLQDELMALPLDLGGVGVRKATLDGKPAALGRDAAGAVQLFVAGKGKHGLELELTAPLTTAAAQQTMTLRLPTPPAASLALAVPGNIEVKAGAEVARREYDMDRNETRFELLLRPGNHTIVMSLNNRQVQDQKVIVARSVLVDEVTQGYERLHANVSCRVLQGATDKLQLTLPKGFEVTSIVSTALARWEVKPGDEQQTIDVTLREATSETVVLELLATRAPVLKDWKFPKLDVNDAAGHVAVLGLLVEERLQPQNITAKGLLPLDAVALAQALPDSVINPEKGAPGVRQVVTYYAPSNDYSLTADFLRLPAELQLVSNSLLLVGEQELSLRGGFALTPAGETLFEFRFTAPAPWKVTEVTLADGTPLPIERFSEGKVGERLVVKVAGGMRPGVATVVNYSAVSTPSGWLGDWKKNSVAFPIFRVEGVTRAEGGVAIHVQDDLTVRADKLENLTPLFDNEKKSFGFGDLPTTLAFRYDSLPFAATLAVERTAPTITAQAISMLRVETDHVAAHYEIDYVVEGARTQKLAFSLPAKETPAEVQIYAVAAAGFANATVKEFSSQETKGRRVWHVTLSDRVNGRVKLAADFTRRHEREQPKNLALPLVRAENVEYQTGLIAVEGSAELEVDIQKNDALRAVDVGELAAAEQAVGRRVVGTFGYVGTEPTLRVDVRRGDEHRLPPAIAERAELVTQVDAAGTSVTAARWLLHTKVGFLEIALPPNASLWSILLDGQSTRPQHAASHSGEGETVLLDLGAATGVVRDLQVVYLSPNPRLGFAGKLDLVAPKLFIHEGKALNDREIVSADLQWQLLLPTGYRVLKSEGTVHPDERLISLRQSAATKTLGVLYVVAGGIETWNARMPASKYAQVAQSGGLPSGWYLNDDIQYSAPPAMAPRAVPLSEPADERMPAASEMPLAREPVKGDESKSMLKGERDALQPLAEDKQRWKDVDAAAMRVDPSDFAERTTTDKLTKSTGAFSGSGMSGRGSAPARRGDYWALEGIGTLAISVTPDPGTEGKLFRSFGEDPELNVTLVNGGRLTAAAWAAGLLALLLGLQLTCRPLEHRATYVLVLLLLGAVPPLVTSALDPALPVFDAVFFAGAGLIAWYIVVGAALSIIKRFPRLAALLPACAVRPVAAAIVLALVQGVASFAQAQTPPAKEEGPPVKVPTDAIVIPFDPEDDNSPQQAEKILVPYEKYVELWNRAFPEKKLRDPKLPAPYALAGAVWQGTLGSGEQLTLQGTIELEIFDSRPVQISFPFSSGVLETATLDGKAARVQIVQPGAPQLQPQAAQPGAAPAGEALLVVHAQGQGRKKLVLQVRLPLTQQGGWRVVEAKIPAAPATSLALTVPQPTTEVRLTGSDDRASYETTEANEKLETALPADGTLSLRWRPRVTEGLVDADLVAQSRGVLDIREDAIRLAWQVKCDFRRGARDSFTFSVPKEYTLEQVAGTNIKSWKAKVDGDRQTVEVTLLKAATGSETFGLYLARRGKVGQDDLAQFAAPAVQVAGAALHQGELLIRRSPRLEVETVGNPTLARIDVTNELQTIAAETDRTDPPAIPLKAYQAWRFQGSSYSLILAAKPSPGAAGAEVRTLVAVGSRRSELYTSLRVRPRGLPIYRLRTYLPEGFNLRAVAPSELEWAVTKLDGRQLLTVHLPIGRGEDFEIVLEGDYGKSPAPGSANPVPFFEVQDVTEQMNEVAITADPVDDLAFEDLKNAEPLPVREVFSWVQAVRQPLVKGALRSRGTGASAMYKLTRRPTIVTARTITNVKLTKEAVLETSLLSFRIEQGSISQVSFLLPERLKNARIDALLLRQRTVEPATTGDGQPKPGWVRVKLELQEEVNGDYRVAVAHDRLLPADKETVQPPIIERHPTAQQIVVIENAGRDEVQIDSADYLEELDRQQQAWRQLEHELGSHILRAWRSAGAGEPKLVFHTQVRELVETAKASIGWAELQIAIDPSGVYRGVQQYRIFNQTEQYLEVTLPAGAELWTALVAGEPVKPVESNTPGMVRIPLIKTADGDGDYVVELKYGGRLQRFDSFSPLTVPVLRVEKLRVEQNHVRLFLPESHYWFAFDGTVRQITDSGNLAVSFQEYLGKQIKATREQLRSENLNTRLRAANNLKQLTFGIQNFHDTSNSMTYSSESQGWRKAQEQWSRNSAELSDLNRQIEAAPMIPQGLEGDNRDRLNDLFRAQSISRAKGNATQFGNNFDAKAFGDKSGGGEQGQRFNNEWYEGNKLAARDGELAGGRPPGVSTAPQTAAPGKKGGAIREDDLKQHFQQGRYSRSGKSLDEAPGKPAAATPQADKPQGGPGAGGKLPQIANAQQQEGLVTELKAQQEQQLGKGLKDRELENSARYQQRLDAQNPANNPAPQQNPANAFGLYNGGKQSGGNLAPGGGLGGMGGGMNGPPNIGGMNANAPDLAFRAGQADQNGRQATPRVLVQEEEESGLMGYRSLDVPLPLRGQEYYFMTVGPDVTLTARGIPATRVERLIGLALVVLSLVGLWLITRGRTLERLGAWLKTTPALVIVLLVSGVCFLLGVLPLLMALVAIASASALVARAVLARKVASATNAA